MKNELKPKDTKLLALEQALFNMLLSETIFMVFLIWFVIIKNWDGCYIIGSFVVAESIASLVLAILRRKRIKQLNSPSNLNR